MSADETSRAAEVTYAEREMRKRASADLFTSDTELRVLLTEYDRRGAKLASLRRERDALMAGLLAAILPNLDALTASRVRDQIQQLGSSS